MTTDYRAHPTAIVSDQATIGKETRIWHHAQVREEAVIGDRCILGKSVYVDKAVRIGSGVKIQNRASIYQGVTIEDEVFVGPHVAFTNDKYPRAFSSSWEIVPTLVKKGASIGANSTIICGITIGEYALVGAGSVVTRDVPSQVLVHGNPAKPVAYVCKCGHPLRPIEEDSRKVTIECPRCGSENRIPPSVSKM